MRVPALHGAMCSLLVVEDHGWVAPHDRRKEVLLSTIKSSMFFCLKAVPFDSDPNFFAPGRRAERAVALRVPERQLLVLELALALL